MYKRQDSVYICVRAVRTGMPWMRQVCRSDALADRSHGIRRTVRSCGIQASRIQSPRIFHRASMSDTVISRSRHISSETGRSLPTLGACLLRPARSGGQVSPGNECRAAIRSCHDPAVCASHCFCLFSSARRTSSARAWRDLRQGCPLEKKKRCIRVGSMVQF